MYRKTTWPLLRIAALAVWKCGLLMLAKPVTVAAALTGVEPGVEVVLDMPVPSPQATAREAIPAGIILDMLSPSKLVLSHLQASRPVSVENESRGGVLVARENCASA
jgi:hypothetical protein